MLCGGNKFQKTEINVAESGRVWYDVKIYIQ